MYIIYTYMPHTVTRAACGATRGSPRTETRTEMRHVALDALPTDPPPPRAPRNEPIPTFPHLGEQRATDAPPARRRGVRGKGLCDALAAPVAHV